MKVQRFGSLSKKVWLASSLALVIAGACSDNESLTRPNKLSDASQERGDSTRSLSTESAQPTSPIATIEMAHVNLRVEGSLKPNSPIRLIGTAAGLRNSGRSRLAVRADLAKNVQGASFTARQRAGALSRGVQLTQDNEISFAEPGYYRVTAVVESFDDMSKQPESKGALIIPSAATSLWLLIDENGGRIDKEYDTSIVVDDGRYLSHGSVGAFRYVKDQMKAGASAIKSNSSSGFEFGKFAPASIGPYEMAGDIRFVPHDSLATGGSVGVPNALVKGFCRNSGGANLSSFTTYTNLSGYFLTSCSPSAAYIYATVTLESGVSRMFGYNGAAVNAIVAAGAGTTVTGYMNNNNAVETWINTERYNSYAVSVFGRYRSRIDFWVSETVNTGSSYDPNADHILIQPSGGWGAVNRFVVTHEYGHAFHWGAIDHWASPHAGSCSGMNHYVDSVFSTACAYIEGFADFYSARIRNHVDGTAGAGDVYSQAILEGNPYRLNGNGLQIEGAFAALLIDMVDQGSQYSGGVDDDPMSLSSGDIAEIMLRCRMNSPSTYLLAHSDQFVYCAENSLQPKNAAPFAYYSSWGSYASLSYDSGMPTLPNQSDFRASWLYNFYNQ